MPVIVPVQPGPSHSVKEEPMPTVETPDGADERVEDEDQVDDEDEPVEGQTSEQTLHAQDESRAEGEPYEAEE
jgi:hypothetical protein